MNENQLYKYAEKKANLFNVYSLLLVSLLAFIAIILNEIGIFLLDKTIVRVSMIVVILTAIIPIAVYFFNDRIIKKNSILENAKFKWIVISSSFLSILFMAIALSFHATLVLILPTLMAAQYKNQKSLTIVSVLASMIMIVISIYGSLLFGIYDANLLKPLTEEEANVFENRVHLFHSTRVVSILMHYVIPEMLCVGAIDYICFAISKRNREMLNEQIELSNKVQEEILSKAGLQNGVIEHLANIIESRDIETGIHIKRTKEYVSILVNKMRHKERYVRYLTPKMQEYIVNAAPLHDIGKIAVSDLILCKPGKLTIEEYEKMKIHTIKGGEIINSILHDLGDKEFLTVAYDIAMSHHEKWDGSGYPYNLSGENIPLAARIMAIADVFDALVSKRVYKEAMPIDDAIDIIIHDSGTHFDPNLVEVFKEVKNEFIKVAKEDN